MRKSQISASMMCSNLVDLQAAIDVFEKEIVEDVVSTRIPADWTKEDVYEG